MSPPCSCHSRFTGKPARLTNKRRKLWVNLYGPGQQPGPLTPRSRAARPAASSQGRSHLALVQQGLQPEQPGPLTLLWPKALDSTVYRSRIKKKLS
eukprot:scaffold8920_cov131-Isochrysis_galbana.AAC.6